MQPNLAPSELVLNNQNRIYHLNCAPEDIADTICLVGDPFRVNVFDKYFDKIEFSTQNREFVTHTGMIGKKRLTVISTGISTANIDIVLNELDALVNIDFKNREPKKDKRSLTLIRVGTSGSLQNDIPLDSLVVSSHGISMSCLLKFYPITNTDEENHLLKSFIQHTLLNEADIPCTIASADQALLAQFSDVAIPGITVTCPGFYAPQGRHLRIPLVIKDLISNLCDFEHESHRICNFEMETCALYGLSQVFNHRCLSVSAVLANRITGEFSKDPKKTIDQMVDTVIQKLV